MTNAIALPQNAIFQDHNQIKTTSLKVAEAFNKLHKDVLRKIESLDCSAEFASAHFYAHDEMIQAGPVKRLSKVYEMTKDGFMFLVMGFTGKKAAQIKEAYINEFNRMADLLNGRGHQQPSTVEDRHPLNIAVRSLANQRSAQGKPADYASVWRTVNGYLGVEHIEDASKEQVQKGLSYVQTLLEGELLPKEQLPEPSQKLDYSVKRWVKMNPWFSHRQSLMPQGRFQVTPDMVYGMDAKSPTLALVKELSDQGHDLHACQLEVLALRHHLESTRNALYSIQQRCNTSLTGQGFFRY
ncbi:phage regulatory protein, rha family [Marinospirillum celere]|uniref:Phage regulatory protein, rha family n=1 Tax=Marinospirillum celere TaxID=1122252 RepID=A0A1I1E7C7_9GAMM|nr:Rha family transcriptional regulator [Marinospirillum celere]SFB80860.1 phage regulatory protein, rha family [Marinospirillum celere]